MTVRQLVADLYEIPLGHTSAYLWNEANNLTLVDTGVPGSSTAIAAALESLGHTKADLQHVFLTHWHVDHAGAAAELAEWENTELHAHSLDADVLEGKTPQVLPGLPSEEQALFDSLPDEVKQDTPTVAVDDRLEGGESFEIAGILDVYHMPGHTPGSISLHLTDPNVLLVGDTVANVGPDGPSAGVFNTDPQRLRESVKALARLWPAVLCPGHGEPITQNTADRLNALAGSLD
ncbi:MBL fold metallo-hydrolase [Salininema proteolyticum]|uniref:MBL fold metallo-hydrolase n=1 Tax=Salininema proteolyticum TaxID=1607685 RepID=A0ABV8U2X7_9ACTN